MLWMGLQADYRGMSSGHSLVTTALELAIAAGGALAGAAWAAGPQTEPPSLVRSNDCLQCHDVDKEKDGPSFRKIAEKYRGRPDAERRLATQMAHGEKTRFADGHEESHKPVKTSPPRDMAQINELVQWILAQ
jgi:cytochrome c